MQAGSEPEVLEPEPGAGTPKGGSFPVLAALSAAAAAVHFAMVPLHAGDDLLHGIGFAVVGWFQLVLAVLLYTRATKAVLTTAIVGNVAILIGWVISRTAGLPGGAHAWHPESVTWVDATTSAMEAGLVIGAAMALAQPAARAVRQITPGELVGVIGVLALTSAMLASPDAREHHHGDHGHEVAAGHAHDDGDGDGDGDDHGHGDGHATTISLDDRCDLEFNTASYYREAELAGMDPLGTGEGHDHDHGPEAHDDHETHDEALSAAEIVRLSTASDEEYDDWLRSLNPQRDDRAPDDTMAGGHAGPQVWEPMTDPGLCRQLEAEIELAREVALRYPTPVEAREAGYIMVTGYVPGIAAHYMNFSLVDGTFEVDKPEMLLYDGTGDDANIVGLSYYIVHEGDDEPAFGFAGRRDHYHRHVGLCVRGTVVIGSSTTSKEECEARGGRKQDGGAGWMSHAWVVPGCESPWGIFSAENPKLDLELAERSGEGEPCSGSIREYVDTPGPSEEQLQAARGDTSEEARGS